MPRSPEARFLDALRARGATRLRKVTFRANRRRIYSFRDGRLNLHVGYRDHADDRLFDLLAELLDGRATAATKRELAGWPGLDEALARARRSKPGRPVERRTCCGTRAQIAMLRSLYRALDRDRFGDRLPAVRIRLSSRMTTRHGHVALDTREGRRVVRELALQHTLLAGGNEAELRETMLHEMAHVAAWVIDGHRGHGRPWKRWARRAGCVPRARTKNGLESPRAVVRNVPDLAAVLGRTAPDQLHLFRSRRPAPHPPE